MRSHELLEWVWGQLPLRLQECVTLAIRVQSFCDVDEHERRQGTTGAWRLW